MLPPIRVCLQGFSAFEHGTLSSSLRLAVHRQPRYMPVEDAAQADLFVVDADNAVALADLVRWGRLEDAVFVASQLDGEGAGWMARPLDPGLLLRELDRLTAMRQGAAIPALLPDATEGRTTMVAPPHPTLTPGADAPHALTKPRALIVDDSELASHFLETFLRRFGLDIDKAAHSGRAIELLAHRSYAVVFLDIELGPASDLDGLALCQHIKRLHRHAGSRTEPVVVMLSAHHGEVDRARGALAGCDGYLGKPLDDDLLHSMLRHHGVLRADKPVLQTHP